MRTLTAFLALVTLLAYIGQVSPGEQRETGLNDQGFITTWLLLAAIPLDQNQTGAEAVLKEQVKDEAKLEPKPGDKVKIGDAELVWKEYKAKEYYFDFNDFLGITAENSAGYAVCYIHADADMKDLKLRIGCDDQAKIYLNGKAVFMQDRVGPLFKDKHSIDVTLKKGVNALVIKVINEKMEWSGCARFTTKTAQIVKNLKVTTAPAK